MTIINVVSEAVMSVKQWVQRNYSVLTGVKDECILGTGAEYSIERVILVTELGGFSFNLLSRHIPPRWRCCDVLKTSLGLRRGSSVQDCRYKNLSNLIWNWYPFSERMSRDRKLFLIKISRLFDFWPWFFLIRNTFSDLNLSWRPFLWENGKR